MMKPTLRQHGSLKHVFWLLQFAFYTAITAPFAMAQSDLSYQTPPAAIAQLADAPLTPLVSLNRQAEWMLLLHRTSMPGIEELSEPELRLGGLRINPANNGPSRSRGYSKLVLRNLNTGQDVPLSGWDEQQARVSEVEWTEDGRGVVFTLAYTDRIELWTASVQSPVARKISGQPVNDVLGDAFVLVGTDQAIYKAVSQNRQAVLTEKSVPKGPAVQESSGKQAAVRTYQDLLRNPQDEQLFDYYAAGELFSVQLSTGAIRSLGINGVIKGFSPSPDGRYLMVMRVEKPYSYLVPVSRFPESVEIFDAQTGRLVHQVVKNPLAEDIPKGFDAVRKGPRSFSWRADAPATLCWAEALDGGDPAAKADFRDQVMLLAAPFNGQAQTVTRTTLRYSGITWGTGNMAVIRENWWANRRYLTRLISPDNSQAPSRTLFEGSTEDVYNDPGNFQTTTGTYGRRVLMTNRKGDLFLTGNGASAEGNRPFVDRLDLKTMKTERLWRSEAPYYEMAVSILDPEKILLLTRRESATEVPNYFLRDLKKKTAKPLTAFENPYPAMEGVARQDLTYQRADGVQLTGKLYLPAGYRKGVDAPLPVLMWAYPREFKSADAAGQVRNSPYEFIRLSWGSPVYWVTQGYAVLDEASMPIIGEKDAQPNDTFIEQLTDNAEAAIKTLVGMGVADPNRIAVGGHSYGAFMTANLLAHTNLFAAGIARSGAYNRTLTPFGFQNEERTFWESPEVYFKMSPFMHAHQFTAPILLIHGEADNNSGTFPMQSERLYAALKGHGATARLVMLPHESHGYQAKESVMHTLWEMHQWLEKHVKNRAAAPAATEISPSK